jgi:hypothetical protein
MGKYDSGYGRAPRDFYPSPSWVVEALGEYVDLRGRIAWEPAGGDGRMVRALLAAGCVRVFCSDIVDNGDHQHEVFDFLSLGLPPCLPRCDLIVTNPPFGTRGRLAAAFIEAGLRRIEESGSLLALLLPSDFDGAKLRPPLFRDCPHFIGKIVLTRRIVWFQRDDGEREAPKTNHGWFLWARNPLRVRHTPVLFYAPNGDNDDA